MKEIEISLVIPVFNEAARILPSLHNIVEYLSARGTEYEILVVDDGSTDDTQALCRQYAESHPEVIVTGYQSNRGKGYAVKTGISLSRGRFVAFSDADLPVPPYEFDRFLGKLQRGYDLVIGSRYLPSSNWKVSRFRKIMGLCFILLVRLLVGAKVTDSQFGFKLFKAYVAKDLFSLLVTEGFAFDAELLRNAQRRGYKIAELPVKGSNAPGSKVRPVRDAVRMMAELIALRLQRSPYRLEMEIYFFSRIPLSDREATVECRHYRTESGTSRTISPEINHSLLD